MDWLRDFVDYASFGEASPRLMWWVGVSTIAGALRRKVWTEHRYYQFTPNFYILVVGKPGAVKKSTSMDVGMNLLFQVPGIEKGPSMASIQALIEYMARQYEVFKMKNGEMFPMSCVTLALSEFGSLFDPQDRLLADTLTDIYDSKRGTIEKITKTSGNDLMTNPYLNIIAGCTPTWMQEHFPQGLIGSGLASRITYLYEEKRYQRVAYPELKMPPEKEMRQRASALLDKLTVIANYEGEAHITKAAYEWGERWYDEECDRQESLPLSAQADFSIRNQGHLHKLAIIISASRGDWPVIDVAHMQAAKEKLDELQVDAQKIFGVVGQTRSSGLAKQVVEVVEKEGPAGISKQMVFSKHFCFKVDPKEFAAAVAHAVYAKQVTERDGRLYPIGR